MTGEGPTPYEVLGVREDATAEQVRAAYVELARRWHPDHLATTGEVDDDGARMRALNEAWAVLGSRDRRRRYDAARPRPFRPFEPDDDEPDPRLAPDVPYRPAQPEGAARRSLTLAPVLLLGASIVVGAGGAGLGYAGLVALAVVLFALACVGFVALPLLALGRASRDLG